MKNTKSIFANWKLWCVVLAVLLLLAAVSVICIGSGKTDNTPTLPTEDGTYTVCVTTASGQPLSKIDVFVYTDASLSDMVAVARTDASGIAVMKTELPSGSVVTLKGVPAGYLQKTTYAVTGRKTELVLESELIASPDLTKEKFRLNDVMFDFTVTDTEGRSYTLSELLQEKKAVVLNFWFAQCGPCKAEFPFLQEAYGKYSDDIALLALNPIDSEEDVAQYRTTQQLTIPMASVDMVWMKAFDMQYFPTTMIIDRYGNINMMYVGSVPNATIFENVFAYYAAEDYRQQIGLRMDDFVAK